MDRYIFDCLGEDYETLISLVELPDADDRHVLAAAIKAGAGAIVIFNLKDFPSQSLKPQGIDALSPDEFILDVISLEPETVLELAHAAPTRNHNQLPEPIRRHDSRRFHRPRLAPCGGPSHLQALRRNRSSADRLSGYSHGESPYYRRKQLARQTRLTRKPSGSQRTSGSA